ncbi:Protein of unknown function DUF1064 [uncultured Caudovirales phage]|uniref:DUF1064 domain-containing protein n=1 Tax=uncultured Caudovirales phage TaxID=2100421 RepID=A0A6J5KKE7_9CAUD|nr:Protein of unknown function DUF1064 [uncultured Caudovirales phage]CAB4123599.1 Protein of unknown function DUF1064 [uncultured Caudovirales phage]
MQSNKFRAVRTDYAGLTFDSKAEARRYAALLILVRAGRVRDLVVKPKFELRVNGAKVGSYIADFSYYEDDNLVVEDVKSKPTRTPVYRLKAKLMMAIHGIEILEVYAH